MAEEDARVEAEAAMMYFTEPSNVIGKSCGAVIVLITEGGGKKQCVVCFSPNNSTAVMPRSARCLWRSPSSSPNPLPKEQLLPKKNPNPSLITTHSRTSYYKPVPCNGGVIGSSGDRPVIVGDFGVSYLLPEAPFEFQFSYSKTPKARCSRSESRRFSPLRH